MKQVAGNLRLDLAQFRELESFAAFGSDVDEATRRQLVRGERLVEILKQPQYQPLPLEKQVAIIYAGTKGYLDKYETGVLAKYEEGLYNFIETKFPELFTGIAEKKALTEELESLLKKAITSFDEEFKDTI